MRNRVKQVNVSASSSGKRIQENPELTDESPQKKQ
jgi:hypothetical protein